MDYRIDNKDEKSVALRQEYLDGLQKLTARREQEGLAAREKKILEYFENPEKVRKEFREMLGWPLTEDRKLVSEPTSEFLAEDEYYEIYRMQFEILEDLRMGGIFFKLKKCKEPRPLVIVQHGGAGTADLVAGFYGSTANYNDMAQRVMKYNVHVFLPQLLIWNKEAQGPGNFNREQEDIRLKRAGSSITAVEVFGIEKILDYFETQSFVKNFGMVGLSYGGFYTLCLAASDPRIRSAISCSFFSDRTHYAAEDWTWKNAAFTFSDAEVACLAYPRRMCIEVGTRDTLFKCEPAISEFERLKKLCAGVGTDWVDFIVFDGEHEFCRDDAPVERLVRDLTEE